MLRAEARWISEALSRLADDAFPMLNLGSSTGEFRSVEQPWIDEIVFAPLRARGRRVIHVDSRIADGVDVVADLSVTEDVERVRSLDYNSILCTNLLEHLPDPAAGARLLIHLTEVEQAIVVTGPLSFPLHPDPIDNGFRGTPEELRDLFGPHVRIGESSIIADRRMFDLYAEQSRHGRLSVTSALLTPWRNPGAWRTMARWSWRTARAAGVVLWRVDPSARL